jgi:hypothetical protein
MGLRRIGRRARRETCHTFEDEDENDYDFAKELPIPSLHSQSIATSL